MKINKKIIVSTLAIAMGATLAGSISGTVAWYQYSTRAQASYIGTSVGESENLEIKTSAAGAKWKSELKSSDINAALGLEEDAQKNLRPVTSGALAMDANVPAFGNNEGFYANPEYGMGAYSTWHQADASNIIQFDLTFRYKKVTSGDNATQYLTKNLNLVDLTIKDDSGAGNNLYKAIRVHFAAGSSYNLFARDDDAQNDSPITTNVYGKLDTGNNNAYDLSEGYEWETRHEVVYGSSDNANVDKPVQVSNNASKIVANDRPFKIGELPASDSGLTVRVTIWIEGWQKLAAGVTGNKEETDTAIWNPAVYANKTFKVGMRFNATDQPANP